MASTSTNKQPLLIDRVFNEVINTSNLYSGSTTDIDIKGTNAAAVLVNCTTNDGGIVEDLYAISRGAAETVLFYFSSAIDYLRTEQAIFVGSISSGAAMGAYANVTALPRVLAPVPQQQVAAAPAVDAVNGPYAGSPLRNQALYVPTGKALWVTVQGTSAASKAPIVGAQGGFY